MISDLGESAQWLREHLARQALSVAPLRFAAFALAHQRLQAMTEHLRQRSLPALHSFMSLPGPEKDD